MKTPSMIAAKRHFLLSAPRFAWVLSFYAIICLPLSGQTASNPSLDPLWQSAILHQDDSNPYLQEFKLRGRYHGQYHEVHSDSGDDQGWEDRRSRLGFDAKLFAKKLELRMDFQSNDGFEDIYDGLVDAYLRWKPTPTLNITVGKLQPLIAYNEWLTSVNDFQTEERSHVFNQFNINRATGLTVDGVTSGLLWQVGIYANDTPGSTYGSGSWGDGEWGDLSGGVSSSVGIGYDFKDRFRTDKALFRVDWMHAGREVGDLVLARYDDIISATMQWKQGVWGLSGEVYRASGGDGLNDGLYSFYILPTYDIIPDKLQLVGRFTYSNGQGPASVAVQSRYEAETPIPPIAGVPGSSGRGDEYHALYLGAQYFIYGNKLKLMGGAEWSELLREGISTGYEGVTFFSALRFYF